MLIRHILMAIALGSFAAPSAAQLSTPEAEEAAPAPEDLFARETPRSTITALIRALAERDYALAANYFALDDAARGARLARALQASLDEGGKLMPFADLSNDPTGRVEDGLPPDAERVGVLGQEEKAPILLTRSDGPQGLQVWRISSETVEDLQSRIDEVSEAVPADDNGPVIAGAPIAHWAILLGFFAAAFLAFRLLSELILWALRRLFEKPDSSGFFCFVKAALPPFSLLLSVLAFQIWGSEAPVSIVARQMLLRYVGIVAWIALAWFAVRLVDAVAQTITSRMGGLERRQAVSVVTLARRAAKLVLVAIAAVAILDTIGIDVTTGIAALGIGGLALALGAQKTVENLVGSVMVVADRPIQVGDFCRVGDVLGTVEDIGMRSTRIRTNDRTVVTIPNGDFSSLQIENFSRRDRFLFNPVLRLEHSITAAELRRGINVLQKVLDEHPRLASGARAKLKDIGASSLEIELFAYIDVPNFDESLQIRQDLLITMLERLEDAGLEIAFPTRTVHVRRDDVPAESGTRTGEPTDSPADASTGRPSQ